MSSLSSLVAPSPDPAPQRRVGDVGPLSYVRNPMHTADELVETLRRIHAEYAEPAEALDAAVRVTVFVTPAVAAALWERMTPLTNDVYLVDHCCRVCGCTEDDACDDGCSWVEIDLCSNCVDVSTP